MPGRNWESGMIGSPASAVPGAMPARMAAPRAAARWRARMGGATVAPESWRDASRRSRCGPHGGLTGGKGFEPRYPAPKTGVLPLDDPPGRGRYYDAPRDRSHRPDPRRGRGDPDALGGAEGAASAVRAR